MRIGDRDRTTATTTRTPRLHCFHHAGGSPAAFRRWPGALTDADVVPAEFEHADQRGQPTIQSLADVWRRRTRERSGIYYGHSMGALVAYEAATQALAEDDPRQVPHAVMLAAPPAPGRPVAAGAHHAPGGVVDERLRDGLDRVRRYHPSRDRLPIPVHVLWGVLDDVVSETDAKAWVQRGSAGSSWHRLDRAGHLFHHAPGPEVCDLLADILRRGGGVRP